MKQRLQDFVTAEEFNKHFVFIDRVEHLDYLQLMSLSSVFLTTFPFGAGITSSDAISVCIPLVVLPGQINVLQFTVAQLLNLPQHLSQQMIATDLTDFGK